MASKALLFLLASSLLLAFVRVDSTRKTPEVQAVDGSFMKGFKEHEARDEATLCEEDNHQATVANHTSSSQAAGTSEVNTVAGVQGDFDATNFMNSLGNLFSGFSSFLPYLSNGKAVIERGSGTKNLNPEINSLPASEMPTTENK